MVSVRVLSAALRNKQSRRLVHNSPLGHPASSTQFPPLLPQRFCHPAATTPSSPVFDGDLALRQHLCTMQEAGQACRQHERFPRSVVLQCCNLHHLEQGQLSDERTSNPYSNVCVPGRSDVGQICS